MTTPDKRPLTLDQARAQYVHRFTMEHVPAWALQQRECGGYYAPQYRSDAEWYALARFPGESGIPKRSRYCESNAQTWPLGQRLTTPYRVSDGA